MPSAPPLSGIAGTLSAAVAEAGGYGGTIHLSAPLNEIEAVAYDLFVQQVHDAMPGTKITHKQPGG